MTSMRRDERGLSESIQYAVILPILMLATLGIIQAGIWVHGRDVALRAANGGADQARGSFGTALRAQEMATKLAKAGGLQRVRVSVTRSNARVVVTVSADAPTIFDVGLPPISETASVPLEQVTAP